jgi:hypothetical protein
MAGGTGANRGKMFWDNMGMDVNNHTIGRYP